MQAAVEEVLRPGHHGELGRARLETADETTHGLDVHEFVPVALHDQPGRGRRDET